MAKVEYNIKGNFDEVLRLIDDGITSGSASASIEDSSEYNRNGVRCVVRVFERYSLFGGNRVSMNVTLVGFEDDLFLTAITAGGSKAMFFKINTVGEESFLQCIVSIIERYIHTQSIKK